VKEFLMTANKGMNRRRFPKRLGVTLPAAAVLGKMGNSELLASPGEYGGFLIRRCASGEKPYQVDGDRYRRFDQRNEVFSRGDWDPKVIETDATYPHRMRRDSWGQSPIYADHRSLFMSD
jgi:hypothetical protein